MRLTRLSPIDADTILPIGEARASLNLTADDSFHDTRLNMARQLGIDFAERFTGIIFVESSFRWRVDSFTREIVLPCRPVVKVDDVTYTDADGQPAALAEGAWHLAGERLSASHGTNWPTGRDIAIDFIAGHASITDVPAMLKAGAIVAMAAYFADQEAPKLDGARNVLDSLRSDAL